MMDDRISQLTAELLSLDPALRGRQSEVRALVSELLAARGLAVVDVGFRTRLSRSLRAAAVLNRPRARLVLGRVNWLYAGLGSVALILLIAVSVLRSPSTGPVQVALDDRSGTESISSTDVVGGAPKLMAARDEAGSTEGMKLIIEEFADGEPIPSQFTCDGSDQRPTVLISGVPEGAKSLLLVVDDYDTRPPWTHWMVLNIDPATQRIGPQELPAGAVEGMTSWQSRGWRGPCPPQGTHNYAFRLFALDIVLDASAGDDSQLLSTLDQSHIIEASVLNNPYTRVR